MINSFEIQPRWLLLFTMRVKNGPQAEINTQTPHHSEYERNIVEFSYKNFVEFNWSDYNQIICTSTKYKSVYLHQSIQTLFLFELDFSHISVTYFHKFHIFCRCQKLHRISLVHRIHFTWKDIFCTQNFSREMPFFVFHFSGLHMQKCNCKMRFEFLLKSSKNSPNSEKWQNECVTEVR